MMMIIVVMLHTKIAVGRVIKERVLQTRLVAIHLKRKKKQDMSLWCAENKTLHPRKQKQKEAGASAR